MFFVRISSDSNNVSGVNSMTKTIISQGLPAEAKKIRQEVFVDEQGFQNEIDDIDKTAWHVLLYAGQQPIACCRLFPSARENTYVLGRLAVRKQYRGQDYGKRIMQEAEKWLAAHGIQTLELSAQVRVKAFYEALGYVASGPEYLDEFCPHIHMEKRLQQGDIPDA